MNKAELINAVSEGANISKAEANRAIDALTETIVDAVAGGDSVTLVGFGTFSFTDKKEREGRNPQNGETITIAARKAPKFKPGKGFKDAVAGN